MISERIHCSPIPLKQHLSTKRRTHLAREEKRFIEARGSVVTNVVMPMTSKESNLQPSSLICMHQAARAYPLPAFK